MQFKTIYRDPRQKKSVGGGHLFHDTIVFLLLGSYENVCKGFGIVTTGLLDSKVGVDGAKAKVKREGLCRRWKHAEENPEWQTLVERVEVESTECEKAFAGDED